MRPQTAIEENNWSTLQTWCSHKHDIIIILRHVLNFEIYQRTDTYIEYDKLAHTKFENLQQVVIWCRTIIFWRQSLDLLYFPTNQRSHDYVSTVMSLNWHEWQVEKLCRYWISAVQYQQQHDRIRLDFPCYLYCSGWPYTLLGIHRLFHWTYVCNGVTLIRHNGTIYTILLN